MSEDTGRHLSRSPSQDDDAVHWAENFLSGSTPFSADVGGTPSVLSLNIGEVPTTFSSDADDTLTALSRNLSPDLEEAFLNDLLLGVREEESNADLAPGPSRVEEATGRSRSRTSSHEDERQAGVHQGEEAEQPTYIEPPIGYGRRRRTDERPDVVLESEAGLWWARTAEGPWHRATFFTDDVRRDFLEEMGQFGSFTHPRPTGASPLDMTSYHPGQRNWGPDRPDRPDILFQHYPPNLSKAERQAQNVFEFLMHKGRIVIDPESRKPVRNFPELPKTISSHEQGWSLEAMSRLNEWINMDDFRDRMPSESRPSVRSLSMRRSRFRWSAGLLAWIPREGSKAIQDYLDAKLPKSCLESNCTRDFRDLYEDEREEMKRASKGKYPERARKNKRPAVEQEYNEATDGSKENIKSGSSKKKGKKRQPTSRPASRVRSRSPHAESSTVRDQTRSLEPEGKGKEKVATEEPEEELEASAEENQEPYDWRDQEPDEHEDIRAVHYALMPSRYELQLLIRMPIPFPSNQRRSYNEQYEELQQYLESIWNQRWGAFQIAPRLPKYPPWWNGFPRYLLEKDWPEPVYLDPRES